ncbi:hypothetical protein SEUCBS139899_000158 [Sporothrix eucalyptigena]
MSSLTISSTAAIVAHSQTALPSTSPATNAVATTSQPSQQTTQRPRWLQAMISPSWLSGRSWSKKLRVIRIQQCFLAGVAILELLSVIIIIILNTAGGQKTGSVSAPDLFLLQWPKNVSVDARENKTETYTLYWYLNSVVIQNGTEPLHYLSRQNGLDFDWREIDNDASRFIYHNHNCSNSSSPSPTPTNTTSLPTNSTSNTTTPSNHSTKSICDLPRPDEITDNPAALNGQPAFGRASFALYVIDITITGLAWPFIVWLNGNRSWQKRGRIILACTKGFATLVNVAAAALLAAGIAWVAKSTGPGGPAAGTMTASDASSVPTTTDSFSLTNNVALSNLTTNSNTTATNSTSPSSTMPVISAGPTASNLIWISAIGQIFATVFFIASCLLLWQKERNQLTGGQRQRHPNMRQRPGSLPVYRPRDSNARRGDDDEDLPPYQRDDPLGRPPSIPGYTISNGCTVAFHNFVVVSGPDCIPLNRVGSSGSSSGADADVAEAAWPVR